MKRLMAFMAMIVAGLIAAPALAQPLVFFGEIGTAPVFVSLDRDGDKLSGYYFYLHQGKAIRLDGAVDAAGFSMDEFSFVNNDRTGSFTGKPGAAAWSGTWRSPDGRSLTFSLRPDRNRLSDLNGRLQCKAGEVIGEYRYLQSLDLTAAKGRMTRFSFSNTAKSQYDENDCAIAMSELKQIASPSGIVLRAKEDDPADTSASALHCSLRLMGSGDDLVILVSGCQGAGQRMFCSSRGGWSDLIVNRKTKACKAID
jgi:hypothetical protein